MLEIKVFDHGFVRLRNLAGPTRRQPVFFNNTQVQFFDAHDHDAPNAARMSFDQSDLGRSDEEEFKLANLRARGGWGLRC